MEMISQPTAIVFAFGELDGYILPIVEALARLVIACEFEYFKELLITFINNESIDMDIKKENLTRLFIFIVAWCNDHTNDEQEQFAMIVVKNGADIYEVGNFLSEPCINMVNTAEMRERLISEYNRYKSKNRLEFIMLARIIHKSIPANNGFNELTPICQLFLNNFLKKKEHLLRRISLFL